MIDPKDWINHTPHITMPVLDYSITPPSTEGSYSWCATEGFISGKDIDRNIVADYMYAALGIGHLPRPGPHIAIHKGQQFTKANPQLHFLLNKAGAVGRASIQPQLACATDLTPKMPWGLGVKHPFMPQLNPTAYLDAMTILDTPPSAQPKFELIIGDGEFVHYISNK